MGASVLPLGLRLLAASTLALADRNSTLDSVADTSLTCNKSQGKLFPSNGCNIFPMN